MADEKKFEQILHFALFFLFPFLTRKQIPTVGLAVLQGRYPRMITI